MLGSETAETNLRTMLFPCYLQLLGVDVGERDCGDESADDAVPMLFAAVGGRCWGARLRRRICGCCCSHAICSCWGSMLGSETAETNLRTMLFPCYLQQLGVDVRERDCGDASVTMLFAAVRTMLLPCYLQLLGVDVGERDCGDESADDAVCMLFAAVGGRCWGARLRRRICGRCCSHAICSCWG